MSISPGEDENEILYAIQDFVANFTSSVSGLSVILRIILVICLRLGFGILVMVTVLDQKEIQRILYDKSGTL